MKISVLITVHNRFHLLKSNLLSLSRQSVTPDEVIISDDGSREKILKALQSMAPDFSFRLRYVRQENKGFRAARVRNNAANLSTGDLLIFLDQDIVGTHGFIETFAIDAKPGEFRVAYPVRLSQEQTEKVTGAMLASGDFGALISAAQFSKVIRQYRKEVLYARLHALHLRRFGPKLRSGVFSVFRQDYFKVNGFDEMYRGWGNEDDDLGRRFHAAGITGFNPFRNEFPLHLYHEPNNEGKQRPNFKYYKQRIVEIHRGDFRCRYGVDRPMDDEMLETIDLN